MDKQVYIARFLRLTSKYLIKIWIFLYFAKAAYAQSLPINFLQNESSSQENSSEQKSSISSPQPRQHRLIYQNLLGARHNPWGLVNRFTLAYQYRLYHRRGILWDPAYIGVSLIPAITPASIYVAGSLDINPLAVLQIRVFYGFYQLFSSFRGFQSFPSPNDNFSDTQLRARTSKDSTNGGRGGVSVLLQGKVGPFAVRNEFQTFFYHLRLPQGSTVFYDILQDTLVASPGWLISNDSDFLYLSPVQWIVGLRASVVHAFYPTSVFRSGEDTTNPTSPYFRLGPVLSYTFRHRPRKNFQDPTLIVHAAWNVLHPNRAGQDVSQAIPTTFLAFTFSGQLWSKD